MSNSPLAQSEYLQYLPELYRGEDDTGTRDFLPSLLLAFQKILTGVKGEKDVEDDIEIRSPENPDGKEYQPLESTIDQLDRYFDPLRTDPQFLDWLASWVALEVRSDWTTAEKRKMIARMVRVVKRVGLKSGLYDFLDIYATEKVRPRVVIDDDEALYRLVLNDDGSASANVLAHASLDVWGGTRFPFLYRPMAIAVRSDPQKPENVRYLVADAGRPGGSGSIYPPMIQPALWLLKPNGEPDDLHWTTTDAATGSPIPLPINIKKEAEDNDPTKPGRLLLAPVAVAFDPTTDKKTPADYLVLDRGKQIGPNTIAPRVYRYSAKDNTRTELVSWKDGKPVDMIADAKADRLIVLDEVGPRLRIVKLGAKPTTIDLDLASFKTAQQAQLITHPTAIAREDDDTFVITDARDDPYDTKNPPRPGTLLRVTIKQDKVESVNDLLEGLDVKRNRLVYPTGVVVLKPGEFLVCDTGAKQASEKETYFRTMAEPAAVFRVELRNNDPKQTAFTLLTQRGMLSWPSRIVRDETAGAFLVTDRGENEIDQGIPTVISLGARGLGADKSAAVNLPWRGQANRFGVSILYSIMRLDLPTLEGDDAQKKQQEEDYLNRANDGIELVIHKIKPLHSTQVWNPFS